MSAKAGITVTGAGPPCRSRGVAPGALGWLVVSLLSQVGPSQLGAGATTDAASHASEASEHGQAQSGLDG